MRKVWYGLASLFLLLSLIVVSVEVVVFDMGFYRSEFVKLDSYAKIQMSEADLQDTTQQLLAYVRGERDDLLIEHEVGGVKRQVFQQKEIDHMVDVRALYFYARDVRRVGLAVFLVTFLYALFKFKRRGIQELSKSFFFAMLGVFVVVGSLIACYVIDFDFFWTTFHKLSFSNDLWLLDPATDILIQIVPEQFFIDCVGKIMVYSVLSMVVCNVLAFIGIRSKNAVVS